MALLGIEIGQGYANTPLASYDPTKWNLPTLWKKRTDLAGGAFIGPIQTQNFRPVESSAAIPGILPRHVQWSSTLDWQFTFDNAAAAATRRVNLFLIDRTGVNLPAFQGFVTLTLPAGGVGYTFQGAGVSYKLYTVGTASVSGTTVTGTSTLWQTNRMSVGSRIVFGTQDPTTFNAANSSVITNIGAEGTITIADNLGTIGNGNYVIEDIILILSTRHTTATNGGLNIVKGLSFRDFTGGGTAIPAATNADNIKACYWLADATTVTNTNAVGLAYRQSDFVDWTHHTIYIGDSAATTNITIYGYNFRNALSNLASGKDFTTAGINVVKTGQQTALTGNVTIVDNNERATTVAGHGAGNGVDSFYFMTASRWYRVAVASIIGASTNFVTDVGTEVLPGGGNLFVATGALAFCKYVDTLDAFIVNTTQATGFRAYLTKYYTDNSRFQKIFLTDDKQLDQQSSFNEGAVVHGTTQNVLQTMGVTAGLLAMAGTGTTAITNIGRILPIGADGQFQIASLSAGGTVSATGQMLISPKITLAAGQMLSSVSVIHQDEQGGGVTPGIAVPCEALYEFYRTSGIADNSGSWTPFPNNDDFSALSISGTDIQFGVLARTVGLSSVPGRVFKIVVTYQDFVGLSNFVGSAKFTDITTKKFGFYFKTAYGGVVPALRIKIYDTDNPASLLVDDNTTSPSGTWERTTDGGSNWGGWVGTDRGNATTYYRYTPASMADNVKATATLGLL